MGRPEQKEQTRRRLIDAALELSAERGFGRALGVACKALGVHFGLETLVNLRRKRAFFARAMLFHGRYDQR